MGRMFHISMALLIESVFSFRRIFRGFATTDSWLSDLQPELLPQETLVAVRHLKIA